jgi:hypothetical protein
MNTSTAWVLGLTYIPSELGFSGALMAFLGLALYMNRTKRLIPAIY